MRQFSGRDDAIDLALAHLAVQYGVAHLSIPAVKDQIKQIRPANVMAHIPPTCSRILQLLESLGGMMPKENSLDPSLVHEILKKLHYSQHELSSETTVKLLQSEKVSLFQITELVRKRFQIYQLLIRTVLKNSTAPQTQGAFSMDANEQPPAGRGRGRGRAPTCGFCLSKDRDDISHRITECPMIFPANIQEVYDSNRCIFCLRVDTEAHRKQKCRITDAAGKPLNNYCDNCEANKIFCESPETHKLSVIPEKYRELGHNVCFDEEEEAEDEEAEYEEAEYEEDEHEDG
jgi:hypothetical protein